MRRAPDLIESPNIKERSDMDKIHHYMESAPLSFDLETTVLEAARHMNDQNATSVLVKERIDYVGIVTETDIIRKVVVKELDPKQTPLSAIMSSPLYMVDQNKTMDEGLLKMRIHGIRHIVVSSQNQVVGMLSTRNFAKYHHQKFSRDNPIAEFWSNYEALNSEATFRYAVEKLVKEYRKTLSDTHKTAQAIDNGDPITIITHKAEDEGLTELAQVLRMVEEV